MDRALREEELASGLLRYLLIGLFFNLMINAIAVLIAVPRAYTADLVIFANEDVDYSQVIMPPIMAYLLAAVINSALNMLFFAQTVGAVRRWGSSAQMLNYLLPGILFMIIMMIRHEFSFSLHSIVLYLTGVVNLVYGYLVWRNLRDVEVEPSPSKAS